MLRQGIVALLAAFAVAGSATAGDLGGRPGSIKDAPAPHVSPLWEGFYVGGNGGYARSDSDGTIEIDGYGYKGKPYDAGPLKHDLSSGGGFAGFQMGFNRLRGNFVFGLEADIQTGFDGGSTTSFHNFTYSASRDVDWFGTLRGRVGIARDHLLIYATAGLAVGQVSYSGHYLNNGGSTADFKSSKVETGYVLGAGLERVLRSNWTLKLEYQYINLGDGKADGTLLSYCDDPTGNGKTVFENDFHTIRLGLNYRFHREPPTPLK